MRDCLVGNKLNSCNIDLMKLINLFIKNLLNFYLKQRGSGEPQPTDRQSRNDTYISLEVTKTLVQFNTSTSNRTSGLTGIHKSN